MTDYPVETDFRVIQKKVHQTAVDHGFWDAPERGILEQLMLIVTELAEAAECYRSKEMSTEYSYAIAALTGTAPKPVGFGVELADAVIRIMDTAEYNGYDLAGLILEKDTFNETRPYKHGKIA